MASISRYLIEEMPNTRHKRTNPTDPRLDDFPAEVRHKPRTRLSVRGCVSGDDSLRPHFFLELSDNGLEKPLPATAWSGVHATELRDDHLATRAYERPWSRVTGGDYATVLPDDNLSRFSGRVRLVTSQPLDSGSLVVLVAGHLEARSASGEFSETCERCNQLDGSHARRNATLLGMAVRDTLTRAAKKALLARASSRPTSTGLRVLAYHEFPKPQVLEEHLDMLLAETSVISEDEVVAALRGERPWPEETTEVLVTADDGYECQFRDEYNNAFAERGIRPLIFLIGCALNPSDLAKHPHLSVDEAGSARPLVSLASLRAGMAAGWTVGGHTWTHPNAAGLGPAQLADEIVGAADRVEQAIQSKVRTFAWPWGKRANVSLTAFDVVTSRFVGAFSTHAGVTKSRPSDPYFISRDAVDRDMTARDVRGLLAAGLDTVRSRRDQ